MNILSELQEIMREVLDDDALIITIDSSPNDFEDWDSLAQIQILAEVERRFNFKFFTKEVMELKIVSDFVAVIEKRSTKL